MGLKIHRSIRLSLESRKHKRGRSRMAFSNFAEQFFICEDLLKAINKKISNKKSRQEARKQHVIGLVTAFEVYLKDKLSHLISKKKIDVLKLIDKKERTFSFLDLEYISKNKLLVGDLIVYKYNFQNLESIEECFSRALELKSFFGALEKYQWNSDDGNKKNRLIVKKDFKKKLLTLLELRHGFVHEINFKANIKMKKLRSLGDNLLVAVFLMNVFIDEAVKQTQVKNL